jgi:predicted small metal-binding protein
LPGEWQVAVDPLEVPSMPYSISCADSGADCPGAFTTATQEELMEHLQVHATTAHPDMEMTPETLEQIQSLIKVSEE